MSSFLIHRCQLFRPSTSAINGLAFEADLQKLAVTRADGTLQVWDTRHHFVLEQVFAPLKHRIAETVIWCKKRLLTTGVSGFLIEWSLHHHNPVKEIKVSPSPVWCTTKSLDESILLLGTEDGAILKFEVFEDENLHLDGALARTDKRILSLALHNDSKTLVSGSINEIKIWNIESKRCLHKMRLTALNGHKTKKKETSTPPPDVLVWSLIITKDYIIVSGDSRGVVSFWDAEKAVLIKFFQSHRSDILSVVNDEVQKSIYVAGIDPAIQKFQRLDEKRKQKSLEELDTIDLSATASSSSRIGRLRRRSQNSESAAAMLMTSATSFVKAARRTVHTHDVRTMTLGPDGFLFSGGVDVMLGASKYPPTDNLKLPNIHEKNVLVSKSSRFVLFPNEHNHLELWKMANAKTSTSHFETANIESVPEKFVDVKLSHNRTLLSYTLAEHGDMIAYSDELKTTVLKICLELDESKPENKTVSLEKISALNSGQIELPASVNLCFTTKDSFLVMTNDREKLFQIYDCTSSLFVKLLREISFPEKDCCVRRLIASCDPQSNLVAIFTSTDNVWIMDPEKRKVKLKLPRLSACPIDAQFHKTGGNDTQSLLSVLYSNGCLVEYDFENGRYTDWTRACLATPSNDDVTEKTCQSSSLFDWQEPPLGFCIDSKDPSRIFMYGTGRLMLLRKKLSLGDFSKLDSQKPFSITATDSFGWICKFCCLDDGQLIVVQVDETKFTKRLPARLDIKRFGKG